METRKSSRINIKEETSGELQSFLASFNDDIDINNTEQTNQITTEIIEEDEEEIEDEDEGTYFVDQAGNYYYQATKDSEPVLTNPPEGVIIDTEENDIDEQDEIENKDEIDDLQDDNIEKTMTTKSSKDFSYVVIMDDGTKIDDDNDTKGNIVYDFDENEEVANEHVEEDEKPIIESGNIIRLIKKPSTTIIQPSANGQFECSHCEYSTGKRYLLARHMKSHSDDRPHKCLVCERGFKTLASLQNHLNTHTGKKPHACKFCTSCFTTSGELVRHVRYRHTHEKPHKCNECDYASVELSKLKRHIRCHTGERPYQCPHCTYASPDTFKLKRHLRIHTGEKPYECDICHAKFTQSNSLKAHKLIHSVGDKPIFQCELCPTTCGRKTDLRIHVQKLHTSENPIKCKRCNKLFPDRYTYKVHAKTHDGEKCFKCDLCPYASISQRHLESHLLIHTDQKPYVCELCDQAFRQKQLLRRHINLYHNKNYVPPPPKAKTHTCPHCGRTFSHKGNLIRHMASHDPESKVKEEAYNLKVGRQKRIRLVGGEPVEVFEVGDEDDDDDDDEDEDEIEMEFEEDADDNGGDILETDTIIIKEENKNDEDDQQYVVLEVIQCDEGEERAGSSNSTKVENDIEELDENEYILSDLQEDEAMHSFTEKQSNQLNEKQNDEDMNNCFGFEEDESDLEENVEDEKHHKSTIKLLEILN